MSEQDIHLQRLFKILSSSQATAKRPRERRHVNYGKVQGMSTRQRQREISERHPGGLRHTAMHDVEAKERSQVQHGRKTHPRSPTPLGISAVMVQDMSGKRINNYPFDLERMNLFRRRHGALPPVRARPPAFRSIAAKTPWTPAQLHAADLALLKEPHAVILVPPHGAVSGRRGPDAQDFGTGDGLDISVPPDASAVEQLRCLEGCGGEGVRGGE